MSDEKPTISFDSVGEERFHGQFGKEFSGHRGALSPRRIQVVAVTAFLLFALPVLFSGPPERPSNSGTAIGIPNPSAQVDFARNLPSYSVAEAAREAERQSSATRRRSESYSTPKLVARPRGVSVPPGTMAKGVLVSGASNGVVRARLSESVQVAGEMLYEEGTLLVGTGQSSTERLMINFRQAVTKDGVAETIKAQALDSGDEIVGLKGEKVSRYATKLLAGLGLNFTAGMSEALQESDVHGGVVVKKPTVKNALLAGTQAAAFEQARESLSDIKSEVPLIEVPSGTSFTVIFIGEQL